MRERFWEILHNLIAEYRLRIEKLQSQLSAPARRTLAALWAVAMLLLVGAAFGLGQIAERRRPEPADVAPVQLAPPSPIVASGQNFELIVLDPIAARDQGRGLAELWLHHADGTATRAEIRPDGRGSVVLINSEGAEVEEP